MQHPDVDAAKAHVLVLGTADWSTPIATNQHYVARELAKAYQIAFAEGAGTRSIRFDRADMQRMLRRIRGHEALAGMREVPHGVRLLTPRLVPVHGPVSDTVNRRLLHIQVQDWASASRPRVLWTYTPYTYGLEENADRVVYHLVDLMHHNTGVSAEYFQGAERKLARTADLALGTSPPVVEHLHDMGFARTRLMPNVADTRPFLRAAHAYKSHEPQRVAIFTGALNFRKLDYRILEALASEMPPGNSLQLVGPIASESADRPILSKLIGLGVDVRGALGIEEVAKLSARARVGLIPYQHNRLTGGISPLKLYEYLAAGLPVVATGVPSVSSSDQAVFVRRDTEEFVSLVLELLRQPPERHLREQRQAIAKHHDWLSRGAELRDMLGNLLDEPSRRAAK